MRGILFRGKRVDNGEWVEGSLIKGSEEYLILCDQWDYGFVFERFAHGVIPTTVGQFTGILDKKGVKIFEGDILVDALREQDTRKFLVQWDIKCSRFLAVTKPLELGPRDDRYLWYVGEELSKNGLIIGNIYDNPELTL